jgi:hypothetical protein
LFHVVVACQPVPRTKQEHDGCRYTRGLLHLFIEINVFIAIRCRHEHRNRARGFIGQRARPIENFSALVWKRKNLLRTRLVVLESADRRGDVFWKGELVLFFTRL